MEITSSDIAGTMVVFRTAGKLALEMHSYLSDRRDNGSDVCEKIREVLNDANRQIIDVIAKDRAEGV